MVRPLDLYAAARALPDGTEPSWRQSSTSSRTEPSGGSGRTRAAEGVLRFSDLELASALALRTMCAGTD